MDFSLKDTDCCFQYSGKTPGKQTGIFSSGMRIFPAVFCQPIITTGMNPRGFYGKNIAND